jgi:hypothetical protein
VNSKEQQNVNVSQVYKPNFVIPNMMYVRYGAVIIYLALLLPTGSSDLPGKHFQENTFPEINRGTFLLDLAPSGVCRVPNGKMFRPESRSSRDL